MPCGSTRGVSVNKDLTSACRCPDRALAAWGRVWGFWTPTLPSGALTLSRPLGDAAALKALCSENQPPSLMCAQCLDPVPLSLASTASGGNQRLRSPVQAPQLNSCCSFEMRFLKISLNAIN